MDRSELTLAAAGLTFGLIPYASDVLAYLWGNILNTLINVMDDDDDGQDLAVFSAVFTVLARGRGMYPQLVGDPTLEIDRVFSALGVDPGDPFTNPVEMYREMVRAVGMTPVRNLRNVGVRERIRRAIEDCVAEAVSDAGKDYRSAVSVFDGEVDFNDEWVVTTRGVAALMEQIKGVVDVWDARQPENLAQGQLWACDEVGS